MMALAMTFGVIMILGRCVDGSVSSSSSSDKFVSLKGNMNASKVYSTQAAFGSASTKTLYSSLRLKANSVQGTKVSTIEMVTPLIKVPKGSNSVRLFSFFFFELL